MWLLSRYRRWTRSEEASKRLNEACGQDSVNKEKVKELLLAGAGPNKRAGRDGATPLGRACEHEAPGVVQCLVDHGASVNAKSTVNQETPLHVACQNDCHQNALILMHNGGDVSAVDRRGETALHGACGAGVGARKPGLDRSPNIAEYLLAQGADIKKADNYGWTPLHLACYYNWLAIVRFLLNHGADVHATESSGKTPLHFALQNIRGANIGVVCCLLENGANPGAVSNIFLIPFQATNRYKYRWAIGTLVGIWSGICGDVERDVHFSMKLFGALACIYGCRSDKFNIKVLDDLFLSHIVFANGPLLPYNNAVVISGHWNSNADFTCGFSEKKRDQLSQRLQTHTLTFPTLKCFCRATIRSHLGSSLIPNMRPLYESGVLPRSLLHYIYLYHEARAVFVFQVGVIDDLFTRYTESTRL